MRFGKRLKEHVTQQKVPADYYVNYKRLKAAIKRGCSEKQFQELYNEELQKFVVNLDRGMADDPKFVEWNRLALDNICKKFDKRNRADGTRMRSRNRARVPLLNTHTPEGERLHGWVYDPELAERVFAELDTEGGGTINAGQMEEGLTRLKLGAAKGVVDTIMADADLDNDGVVSLADFQLFVYKREAEIQRVFASLDRDEDGLLTHADLIQMLERLDLPATDEELDQMVETMLERAGQGSSGREIKDSSGRLMLDYADFRELMLLVPQTASARAVFDYWIKAADVDFDFQLPAERKSTKESMLTILFAGAVAGTVSRTCTAPMDRVKVMMQVDGREGGARKYSSIGASVRKIYLEGAALPGRTKTLLRKAGTTAEIEPWRRRLGGCMAFYRGNGTNCLKIAPENALKFYAYDRFKNWVCEDPEHVKVHERFAAGGMAGMVAQMGIYPMEIVKTRLAVRRHPPSTFASALRFSLKPRSVQTGGAAWDVQRGEPLPLPNRTAGGHRQLVPRPRRIALRHRALRLGRPRGLLLAEGVPDATPTAVGSEGWERPVGHDAAGVRDDVLDVRHAGVLPAAAGADAAAGGGAAGDAAVQRHRRLRAQDRAAGRAIRALQVRAHKRTL